MPHTCYLHQDVPRHLSLPGAPAGCEGEVAGVSNARRCRSRRRQRAQWFCRPASGMRAESADFSCINQRREPYSQYDATRRGGVTFTVGIAQLRPPVSLTYLISTIASWSYHRKGHCSAEHIPHKRGVARDLASAVQGEALRTLRRRIPQAPILRRDGCVSRRKPCPKIRSPIAGLIGRGTGRVGSD